MTQCDHHSGVNARFGILSVVHTSTSGADCHFVPAASLYDNVINGDVARHGHDLCYLSDATHSKPLTSDPYSALAFIFV